MLKHLKIYINDQRGEMLGTMGWMAIVATILVLIHGLITGWLPTFIQRIFTQMDSLV